MTYFMTDVKHMKPKPLYRLSYDWGFWLALGLVIGVLVGGFAR